MVLRKKSTVDKRLKRLEKEISSVSHDLEYLARKAKKDGIPVELPRHDTATGPGETNVPASTRAGHDPVRDERFTDYLASSFQSARPLRHERRIQRNRAIIMVIFVLIVLIVLISKFFL